MFTQLMRESRIYGHNRGHLTSCTKCKEFKEYFEKNVLGNIDQELFFKSVDKEKKAIKNYKEGSEVYLGYKLQSKYFVAQNFKDKISIACPFDVIINKDNIIDVLLHKMDDLPDKFVIKKNKLSGYTIVVDKTDYIMYQENKYKYSIPNLYEILTTVLRYDYDLNPNKKDKENKEMDLFIEEYIPVKEEYKFHCINSKVVMIEHYLVNSGLYANKWYSRDWKELNLTGRDDPYPFLVYPNKNLEQFIEVAESIASKVPLKYIRMDAFTDDYNDLFFGELSHSPNAFHNNYNPNAFDVLLYDLYTETMSFEDGMKEVNKYLKTDEILEVRGRQYFGDHDPENYRKPENEFVGDVEKTDDEKADKVKLMTSLLEKKQEIHVQTTSSEEVNEFIDALKNKQFTDEDGANKYFVTS